MPGGECPAPEVEVTDGVGTMVCSLLKRADCSLAEPSTDTGGRKRAPGRQGWCVSARATEVVAAAACRGAWMRGAQMTEVGDGGVAPGGMRWAQWAMSRSCWTICWMISFSW